MLGLCACVCVCVARKYAKCMETRSNCRRVDLRCNDLYAGISAGARGWLSLINFKGCQTIEMFGNQRGKQKATHKHKVQLKQHSEMSERMGEIEKKAMGEQGGGGVKKWAAEMMAQQAETKRTTMMVTLASLETLKGCCLAVACCAEEIKIALRNEAGMNLQSSPQYVCVFMCVCA